MKRKICIFTAHYLPYLGGVESYTYNLARTLKMQGDQAVIVTSNDMHLKAYEVMDGIPVYRMPCFNFLGGRIPISKINKDFLKIQRRLKRERFDLVLINTRFYPHTIYAAWFAKKEKIRSVILDHGTSHVSVGNPVLDRMFALTEHIVTFIEKKLCKEFYGVSQACCRWLEHFKIQANGVLYNAVDCSKIDEALSKPVRSFRQEKKIQEGTLVVTYTGRLLKEKGILNLIEGVKSLPQNMDVCLMIAGDGEEMSRVKQMADDRIKVLGRLPFEEVAALLGETDIFCLPTEYPEGFPTSVLEAAAAGCYVITTDRGGSKELIQDASYGKILEQPSPDKIAQAIAEAYKNREKREQAALKAKSRVYEWFVWERTAKQVHNLAEGLSIGR